MVRVSVLKQGDCVRVRLRANRRGRPSAFVGQVLAVDEVGIRIGVWAHDYPDSITDTEHAEHVVPWTSVRNVQLGVTPPWD